MSWWWRAQADGAPPRVTSVPPGLAWGLCPGPEDAPQTCTVAASGRWRAVIVDGATLWRRGDAYLPLLTIPAPAGPEGAGAERQRERPAAGGG